MTPTRARTILFIALGLGIAADLIIEFERPRLGFAFWILLAVAAAAWAGRMDTEEVAAKPDPSRTSDRAWLFGIATAAAAIMVLRDADVVFGFAVLLALATAALVVWRAQGVPLAQVRIADVPVAGLASGVAVAGGPAPLVAADGAITPAKPESRKVIGQLALGTVAAVPVVFILTALLSESDPIFKALAEGVFEFLANDIMRHIVVTGFFAWIAAGWLRGGNVANGTVSAVRDFRPPTLGFALAAPALVGTTLLLGAYLGVQARALFGGAAFVEQAVGLSAAEYARRGFFELVVVGMLVLGLLFATDTVRAHDDAKEDRRFRAVGWLLLGLVSVLCVSAVQRLALYVSYYGLTVARFQAAALMVWLVLTLAWFGRTVLRGRREAFGVGVFATSVAWVMALALVNPEGIVARVNVERGAAGERFDAAYNASLSADATPALLRGAGALDPVQCADLLTKLHQRSHRRDGIDGDWRRWSLARAREQAAMATDVVDLVWRTCKRAP